MAMNKKEKAYMETLKILGAFRMTEKIDPDVSHNGEWNELTKGFAFNTHTKIVNKACTTSNFHSRHGDEKTNSQGSIKLYSTKILALKALRHEVEMDSARILRNIDKQIEEEQAE